MYTQVSVGRVSIDIIGRRVDRVSIDQSADTRPAYRPSIGRHVKRNRLPLDRHVDGYHSKTTHTTDSLPIHHRHSIHCRLLIAM